MKFWFVFVVWFVTATDLTRILLGIIKNGGSDGSLDPIHDPFIKEVASLFSSAFKGKFISTEKLSFYAHNYAQLHHFYMDGHFHKYVYDIGIRLNCVQPAENVARIFGILAAFVDSKKKEDDWYTGKKIKLEPLIEKEVVGLFQLFEFDFRGKRSQFMVFQRLLWSLPRNSAGRAEDTREKFVSAMEFIEKSEALLSVRPLVPLTLSIYALCKQYVAILDRFDENPTKIYRAINNRDMIKFLFRLKKKALEIVEFKVPGIKVNFDVDVHDDLIKFLKDAKEQYLGGILRKQKQKQSLMGDVQRELAKQNIPRKNGKQSVETEYSYDELLAEAKQRLIGYRHLIGEKMIEMNGTWYHSKLARLFLVVSDVLISFPNDDNTGDDLIEAFVALKTYSKTLNVTLIQRRKSELIRSSREKEKGEKQKIANQISA